MEREQPQWWDLLTVVANYLLTGMIHQAMEVNDIRSIKENQSGNLTWKQFSIYNYYLLQSSKAHSDEIHVTPYFFLVFGLFNLSFSEQPAERQESIIDCQEGGEHVVQSPTWRSVGLQGHQLLGYVFVGVFL